MYTIKLASKTFVKSLFLSLFLLLNQLCLAQQMPFKNQDKLEAKSKDGLFVMQIERDRPSINSPKNWSWGADGKNPVKSVSGMNLHFKGKEIYVPISAFIDLGEPEILEITRSNNNLIVKIYGGQSSASYKAVLIFDSKHIKQRTVCSAEFPNESCEKTKYLFPKDR